MEPVGGRLRALIILYRPVSEARVALREELEGLIVGGDEDERAAPREVLKRGLRCQLIGLSELLKTNEGPRLTTRRDHTSG